jgi:hypothetical protein
VSDLGRLRIKADLLEQPILPIRISDRAVVRLGAGEDRYLDPTVVVDPLNPPLFDPLNPPSSE